VVVDEAGDDGAIGGGGAVEVGNKQSFFCTDFFGVERPELASEVGMSTDRFVIVL